MPDILKRTSRSVPVWAYGAFGVMLVTLCGAWKWDQYRVAEQFRGATFRIGVDHYLPNHEWTEAGGASGFSVDVMNEAARRAGFRLEWIFCPNGSKAALEKGDIDFWPIAYYRPGEYPLLHQTRPWSADHHAFVWNRGELPGAPESWRSTRIAVMDRLSARNLARRLFPNLELVPQPTQRDALQAMCAGKASVAFVDMRVLENVLLDRPAPCANISLQVRPLPEFTDPMTLFARKDKSEPAEILRDKIDDMIADGSVMNNLGTVAACIGNLQSVKLEVDALNIEEKVKEMIGNLVETVKAVGRCLETEHLRVDNRVLARAHLR